MEEKGNTGRRIRRLGFWSQICCWPICKTLYTSFNLCWFNCLPCKINKSNQKFISAFNFCDSSENPIELHASLFPSTIHLKLTELSCSTMSFPLHKRSMHAVWLILSWLFSGLGIAVFLQNRWVGWLYKPLAFRLNHSHCIPRWKYPHSRNNCGRIWGVGTVSSCLVPGHGLT